MYNDAELKQFDKLGIKRPEHSSHGVTPNELGERLRRLNIRNWRLEGNQLKGMTDMGPFVQTIPSNYILVGTDENTSLPIFRKVVLS